MKFSIQTEKPNEIEATLRTWQKLFGGDHDMIAKFGITTDIMFVKKEKNIFDISLEYSGKIPIVANMNDWFLKSNLMKALKNIDASIKEI